MSLGSRLSMSKNEYRRRCSPMKRTEASTPCLTRLRAVAPGSMARPCSRRSWWRTAPTSSANTASLFSKYQ